MGGDAAVTAADLAAIMAARSIMESGLGSCESLEEEPVLFGGLARPMPGLAEAEARAEVSPVKPARPAAKGKGKGEWGKPARRGEAVGGGAGAAAGTGVVVVPVLKGGKGLSRPFRVGVL